LTVPLQNRVSPFGDVFATPARGTMMGNRGGRLHRDDRTLGSRRWASKQWICCVLSFNDRHRDVWGASYTELFFLDEVTAFAAGHRPCFECRRREAESFAQFLMADHPNPAHSRERGNAERASLWHQSVALGPRSRGDERKKVTRATAAAMEAVLHAERLDGKAKRVHRGLVEALPDGAMIAVDGTAAAVRGARLLPWTATGYAPALPRPRGGEVTVLTPPSTVAVLARGYAPLWHPSAG